MQWFRLYNETIYDRKLRRLPPAQRWLWVAVLTVSRQSPEPGRLLLAEGVAVTVEDLEDAAAIPASDVESGLQAFMQAGMLHLEDDVWVVTNWGVRQRESDDVKQRVRAYRERNRNVSGNVTGNESVTRQIQKQIQNTTIPSIARVSPTPFAPDVGEAPPAASAAPAHTGASAPLQAPPPKRRNPTWDALVDVFGYEPETSAEKGKWGKAVKDLNAAGATPEEIKRRCANHARMADSGAMGWNLTPMALVSHWGELAKVAPPPAGRSRASVAPTSDTTYSGITRLG
jgi:hypothetical protein